jgi:dCMP deaminase
MNDKLKNTFVKHLANLEENSTCVRVKVAAIIAKSGRTVSTGWNGVPSGFAHCEDIFKIVKKSVPFGPFDPTREPFQYFKDGTEITKEEFMHEHHQFSEENEIHAEANAIAFAARNNISTEGAEIFVTITPCSNCAKLILASGIKKLYYKSVYDRNPAGFELLKKAEKKGKIELEKI